MNDRLPSPSYRLSAFSGRASSQEPFTFGPHANPWAKLLQSDLEALEAFEDGQAFLAAWQHDVRTLLSDGDSEATTIFHSMDLKQVRVQTWHKAIPPPTDLTTPDLPPTTTPHFSIVAEVPRSEQRGSKEMQAFPEALRFSRASDSVCFTGSKPNCHVGAPPNKPD